MDPLIIIGLIALAPLLILTLLNVNAATAFLALCLGNLLGNYVSKDVNDLLRGYVAPDSQFAESAISLLLLWIPVVLVSIFMIRTINNRQRIINAVPALAVGLVGVLLTVPFLTPDTQVVILTSQWWDLLVEYQATIVLTGTITSLVLLRMRKPTEGHHGKRN
jgi:hypothetical protein